MTFVDQQQEAMDFEAGVGTEAENTFAHSKQTITVVDESKEIKALRRQGKYVVVSEHDVCCPHTDAILGRSIRVAGSFFSREEAVFALKAPESAELHVLAPLKFWTAERILDILEHPDKTTTLENGKTLNNTLIIYRFLQRMFERQTADEQADFKTAHDNGVGFSGADAHLLSDMATHSKKFNDDYRARFNRINMNGLTVKQAAYAAKFLKHYARTQLVGIAREKEG